MKNAQRKFKIPSESFYDIQQNKNTNPFADKLLTLN